MKHSYYESKDWDSLDRIYHIRDYLSMSCGS